MPLYRYEALDRTGNKVVGAMNAADEHALTSRLATMGYQPVMVQAPQAAAPARTGGFRAAVPAPTDAPVSRLSADTRSVARMFHQLHISFRAGMPAYQALTTVQGQVVHAALRSALGEVAEGVRDGRTLSEMMERFPRIFARGDVGMVRAAEMGGFLPEAMQYLADRHEQDDNTRRRLRIWTWFFHSNVLGFFLFLPVAFCLKAAVPALDIRPGLVAGGQAFLFLTVPLTLLYFGFLAWFYRARHNPSLAWKWHRLLLKLPVAGKLNFLRGNAVFTRVLQQLSRAGVGAETAWQAASASVPNLFLSDRFAAQQTTVAQTMRYSAAMQQTGLLDLTDVGMVSTGEASGEIDQALKYLADRYEEDTRVALGAAVVRGAITFTFYAFMLGALGMAVLAWAYGQGLMKLSEMEL